MPNVWPILPLEIRNPGNPRLSWTQGAGDIIDALGYNDRIVKISLFDAPEKIWQKLLTAMEEPFPALTHLSLWSNDSDSDTPLPALLLSGPAPLLQSLYLNRATVPTLPKLLLSVSDLNDLQIWNIPDSWYMSPKDVVTCLSPLTRLSSFGLGFGPGHRPHPIRGNQNLRRTVLPALTRFDFKGATDYLEDLVIRIEAPLLSVVVATLCKPFFFDSLQPELYRFINYAETFQLLNQADIVIFGTKEATLCLNTMADEAASLELVIPCSDLHWPLSILARVCTSLPSLPSPLSTLEHLTISGYRSWWPSWGNRWLELLPSFTAVKNLYLCDNIAPCLMPVLKGVPGESITEVLPALQNLFLEEDRPSKLVQEAMRQFTTVRKLSGRPVAVQRWNRWIAAGEGCQ
jgi:hypothetical protein